MTRKSSIRAVLDTNVMVSALLFPDSPPGRVLDHITENGSLLVSEATRSELIDVFIRPRFDRYLGEDDRLALLGPLHGTWEAVEITQTITACRDPKDDKFLELAVSGRATHIISGDRDLLALHPFRGIPVLSPRSFLSEVNA